MPVVHLVDVELTPSDMILDMLRSKTAMHLFSNDDGVLFGNGAVLVAGVGDCVILDAELQVHAERDAGCSPVDVQLTPS